MAFRIRSTDENSCKTADIAYREHLEEFSKRDHTLWEYFYWDFFHDGTIDDITFRNGSDELAFVINCPNIQRRRPNGGTDYINIPFRCVFSDVIYFQFTKGGTTEETTTPNSGKFTFLHSEINTLSEYILNNTEDGFEDYQSLIIEVMPAHGPGDSSYIEVIFGYIHVEAIENTAFQLMLASPDFDIPIYTRNE